MVVFCGVICIIIFKQEEENALAQEAALDVLLKADDADGQWPSWNPDVQLTQVRVSCA